ncbi:MAG TPA: Ig domain-containing protein, partial [Opitutaceae bacterium]
MFAFLATLFTSLHAQAPVISPKSTETIVSGNPYSYRIAANGAPTSYSAAGLPAGLTIDTATGEIRGVCGYNTGIYTATLTATNASGTATATQTFAVEGGGPIEMPYVRALTPPTAGIYRVGDALLFRVQFANGYSFPYVSGRPRIALTINGQARHALYAWGSGDEYQLYTYTVTAADVGARGVVIGNTIDLNGGALEDSRPLVAALNLPAADASALQFVAGAPDAAPTLHAPTYAVAQIGRAFSFQVVGTQAPTEYRAEGLPA